jgi:diguanylate cyclase (GGDEF)-like protein/PAS domain S-box-containing protein
MSLKDKLFKKQLSDLKSNDKNYKKWNSYFILISLTVGILWLVFMPANYNLDLFYIFAEAFYLIFVLLILYFFSRLSISFLYIGWSVFSFASFLHFIRQFTLTSGIYGHLFEKILMSFGLIIFTFGVYLFISRYYNKSAEVKQVNKDYESVFKNSQDAIFLIDVIKNGSINFQYNRLNPAHEKMTGFLTEEVQGKTPAELLGEELGSKVRENYLRCFENKQTLLYEEELDLPAGKEIWHTKLTPIFDDQNNIVQLLGTSRNITHQKEMEAALKKNEKKYRELFEESPIGLLKSDLDGNILDCNQQLIELLGAPDKEAVKEHNLNNIPVVKEIWDKDYISSADRESIEGEINFKSKWNKEVYLNYKVETVCSDHEILEVIIACRDISREKEIENKLVYLSFHDQLTGLYNRRYFENELERLNNSRRLPIAVVVGDLDNLKKINDNYGHKKGDQYIKKAAQMIKNNFREDDITARIGGDEFAVLLPETDYETASKISSRLESSCKESEIDDNFHISTGCAVKNTMDEDLEDIFIRADQRMYQEKKANKFD